MLSRRFEKKNKAMKLFHELLENGFEVTLVKVYDEYFLEFKEAE